MTAAPRWLMAVAYSGFFLNLFNLLPISPLDGGRITAVLSPRIWFVGVPLLGAMFLWHPNPMLLLIGLLAAPQLVKAWKYDPEGAREPELLRDRAAAPARIPRPLLRARRVSRLHGLPHARARSRPAGRSVRTVRAIRYVTPLREGGSLPAIVEADDDGLYVLKFRGAGQGPRALIAELVAGELARAAGLPVPEIVFACVDADLARTEPDAEIQDLIRASADPPTARRPQPRARLPARARSPSTRSPGSPTPSSPSRIVWFDAFVTNVDRTPRNTNMLVWHGQLWLIDHGAALYFHHASARLTARARRARSRRSRITSCCRSRTTSTPPTRR